MANRFWVGGTANWDGTAGSKWALTSGGAGGEAVPTSADDVFFDGASGAVTVTVSGTRTCNSITFTGFTGTVASAFTPIIDFHGNVALQSGIAVSAINFRKFGTSAATFLSNGNSINSLTVDNATGSLSLSDAMVSASLITITRGTFTTNNYALTATALSSSNSNTRTINLGSSTVTLSTGATAVNFATSTNLTFNAGTSSIVVSGVGSTFSGGGQTFNNVSFTPTTSTAHAVNGGNTYNNLSFAGRTTAGITGIILDASSTISGTLTLSAGTNATMRTFVRSDTIGTTRTLTCAAVASLTDIDFRDITIAGAAAPVSGTRLGDCKGNSGITFDAAKTVYWAFATSASNWETNVGGIGGWSDSIGGTRNLIYFPLAQDTAVFPSSGFISGGTLTLGAAYNIGTIDMSARTSNTMTLATGTTTPQIYGNWINGTGTTLTGTGAMTFAGRGSQTITSAGRTFTQTFVIQTPNGSVTLQDAFSSNRDNGAAFTILAGTFDASGYNTTFSGASSGFRLDQGGTATRGFLLGSGTLTVAGTGGFNASVATGVTVTGAGTISMTSASAKTFAGGGIQTYPTLNQGGTGTLTVSDSNKFAGLTNTAIGRIQFTGGTTNEFTSFTINGVLGNLLQLGATNTTQAILIKPTAWQMGLLSFDAGNNTGLNFLASDGTMNYLSVSYINGQVVANGYTITATNGTYAVAGQTATLLRSRLITATNGTYAVSGQAATLLRSRLITSSTGYYNVDGYPATIVIGGAPPIIVTDQLLIKLRSFTEIRRF
jgi:hypothetical protein